MSDTMTRAEAEKLPTFEECAEHEIGAFYLWGDFTDPEHAFFVRPVVVNEIGCLADVFGIHDSIVKPMGRERFIRQDDGKLRLLDE
ncbi:hypothetical protein [Streptomyces sp. NPDC056154]|uniref:hypothetical protein n=1 Tax=unclassified Streptomyces TaxID=2593676 RepID=UPI0035D744DF